MTTKYNVGDKIWVAACGNAQEAEIKQIICDDKKGGLKYYLYYLDGWFFESQLHLNKLELIGYLINKD